MHIWIRSNRTSFGRRVHDNQLVPHPKLSSTPFAARSALFLFSDVFRRIPVLGFAHLPARPFILQVSPYNVVHPAAFVRCTPSLSVAPCAAITEICAAHLIECTAAPIHSEHLGVKAGDSMKEKFRLNELNSARKFFS